jgi:hypothetical protein
MQPQEEVPPKKPQNSNKKSSLHPSALKTFNISAKKFLAFGSDISAAIEEKPCKSPRVLIREPQLQVHEIECTKLCFSIISSTGEN